MRTGIRKSRNAILAIAVVLCITMVAYRINLIRNRFASLQELINYEKNR